MQKHWSKLKTQGPRCHLPWPWRKLNPKLPFLHSPLIPSKLPLYHHYQYYCHDKIIKRRDQVAPSREHEKIQEIHIVTAHCSLFENIKGTRNFRAMDMNYDEIETKLIFKRRKFLLDTNEWCSWNENGI